MVAYIEDTETFNTDVGDLDLDGDVDGTDFYALTQTYNNQTPSEWQFGDLDGDGTTDSDDEYLMNQNLGWSRP